MIIQSNTKSNSSSATNKLSTYKRIINWFFLLLVFVVLGISGAYIWIFHNQEISKNSENWGQFGDYFGGILNPILSLFNLLVLYVIFLKESERHEELESAENKRHIQILHDSVRPYGEFHLSLVNEIKITFKNHGVGPLIIKRIYVERDGQRIPDLAQSLSAVYFENAKKINFRNEYLPDGDSAALSKEDTFNLLTVQTQFLNDPSFRSHFDTLVSFLSEVTIKIEFTDLYENKFEKKTDLKQWKGKGGYFLALSGVIE